MKRVFVIMTVTIFAAWGTFAQESGMAPKLQTMGGNESVNIDGLINKYFDSLNETNNKRRRELTRLVWVEKGKFGTPYGEVEGWDAIDSLVAGVQRQFPHSVVRRTSRIDGFGAYLRWSFTLSDAAGTPILSGVDFAVLADGKLQLVMGFFDFAPSPAGKPTP